ncbi:MAG TPA: TIM barrel protein [Herpetosiphonaceae bacterium]|nr:TIM barrel protein [Herpetosiphonaceae bacterium]
MSAAPQQPSPPRISFITANFVARQLGYNMTGGWGQGDRATNDFFRPIETFGTRFEDLLKEIRAMGFEVIDLWLAHLHWSWATPEHIEIANDLLSRHNMAVTSLAGGFGTDREELEAACKLAVAMNTTILGGSTSLLAHDRPVVVALLKEHGVRLGIENHPEKTAAELLAKIGDGGDGTIGAAVDTGWFGTHGYDAARALEEIGELVFHVHLKDVRSAGGHETCRFGEGVVPIEECVRTLQRMGYRGGYGIEHEPEHFDPTADCTAMLHMLQGWLNQYSD